MAAAVEEVNYNSLFTNVYLEKVCKGDVFKKLDRLLREKFEQIQRVEVYLEMGICVFKPIKQGVLFQDKVFRRIPKEDLMKLQSCKEDKLRETIIQGIIEKMVQLRVVRQSYVSKQDSYYEEVSARVGTKGKSSYIDFFPEPGGGSDAYVLLRAAEDVGPEQRTFEPKEGKGS